MSTRRHWRCPRCGKMLAYARQEMLILRRLAFTDDAAGHVNEDGVVTVRCKCGATITIRWAAIQL